jgi:NAD(P)-dependent dehydrogenase (short-subunit alcohol dehydrogenase family)
VAHGEEEFVSRFRELMNLSGRRAVITGASGHIGRVIAETLGELGADLVLVDLSGSELKECEQALASQRVARVDTIECDLESEAERSRLIGAIDDVTILVNNAAFVGSSGLPGWTTAFEKQELPAWRRAMEVNLTAVFDLVKGFAPKLSTAKGASVINIASIYGQFGPDYGLYEGTGMGNPAAYAASKGGLLQLTRWMATTLAPRIRVNAISPGGVFRNQPPLFVERYEARTPLARMACEDDVRGAIGFLASDLSAYVTGQNIAVDGGWGVW